jgi:hypothetical protein
MKISVVNARAFAKALNDAADEAMKTGEHEFELVNAMQSVDNAARAELEQAIAAAKADQG